MKLNTGLMKDVINYVIEKSSFNFDTGKPDSIYFTSIVRDLANGDENKMKEVAFAILRCLNEGFIITTYPRNIWATAEVIDVTLRGFSWLEQN